MLLETIRTATRLEHEHLESRLGLFETVRTREDFVRMLGAYYGFYATLEPLLEKALGEWGSRFQLEARKKLARLEADLRFFAADRNGRRSRRGPLCSRGIDAWRNGNLETFRRAAQFGRARGNVLFSPILHATSGNVGQFLSRIGRVRRADFGSGVADRGKNGHRHLSNGWRLDGSEFILRG